MNDFNGKSIGRYHILEQLGQGGMAVVYKAYDTRLERDVAIKIIRKDAFPAEAHGRILQRFERESKALAKLSHANIVKVYDYGEYEGAPYLVMELLTGGTLKYQQTHILPYGDAARLLAPIARALGYAHKHDILHRDIKPSNILITESGEPVLTDFGIAKVLEESDGQTLTGTGIGLGTPEYMAPEQWLGKAVPASDQYSLGVVFYELVTGHKPYTADTPAAILIKQSNDPLPRPKDFVPGLPATVERVIFKALAKQHENRFADMDAFAQALEKLAQSAPASDNQKETKTAFTDRHSARSTSGGVEELSPVDVLETRDDLIGKRPHRAIRKQSSVKKSLPSRWRWIGLGLLAAAVLAGLIFGVLIPGGRRPQANANTGQTQQTTQTPAQLSNSVTADRTEIPTSTYPPASIPDPTATLGIGSTWVREADGMTMVYVPAGEFEMGSEDGLSNESPIHTVYLDAFWIDQTEVTNGQYEECVVTGTCTKPSSTSSYTRNAYYDDLQYVDYPVIYVDWYQAQAYCQWSGGRLPTEAEWEKAARETDGKISSWGNNYTSRDTTEVGSDPSDTSPYGALDMIGNVWEWVADWYGEYPIESVNNPTGASAGSARVMRGGSWSSMSGYMSTTSRGWGAPQFVNYYLGFRCVQSAGEMSITATSTGIPITSTSTLLSSPTWVLPTATIVWPTTVPVQPTNPPVHPTSEPQPTNTPVPTSVPQPTSTPGWTSVPPKPTNPPDPTSVPQPTNTPVPTSVPQPTNTPVPTSVPQPTNTPVPTSVPQPTSTQVLN